jgi:hemerythrin
MTDDLMTGIKAIDDQHRRLFDCANAVFAIRDENAEERVVLDTVRSVIAYTIYHFRAEEFAMVEQAFPDQKRHLDQHKALLARVATLRRLVEDVAPITAVLSGLQMLLDEWVRYHIKLSDKAFARYVATTSTGRRPKLPSPAAMHKAGLLSDLDYRTVRVVHAGASRPLTSIELQNRLMRGR